MRHTCFLAKIAKILTLLDFHMLTHDQNSCGYENLCHSLGTPSRMHGDWGGENTAVSVWMIMHQGIAHHLCGARKCFSFYWMWWIRFLLTKFRSTHNICIEQLWVEVGTQFCRHWWAFFVRLGHLHMLDHKNPSHLWLLHQLFLDDINDDCQEFQAQWNVHPISGPQTNDCSPAVRIDSFLVVHHVYHYTGSMPSGADR